MAWKNKRKSQYTHRAGLPRPDPLTSSTLEAQELTTKGVCRRMLYLLVYSYPVSELRKGVKQVNAYS